MKITYFKSKDFEKYLNNPNFTGFLCLEKDFNSKKLYLNNKNKSLVDPNDIIFLKNGVLNSKEYPSLIKFNPNAFSVFVSLGYFKNGKIHREDGPAVFAIDISYKSWEDIYKSEKFLSILEEIKSKSINIENYYQYFINDKEIYINPDITDHLSVDLEKNNFLFLRKMEKEELYRKI